MEDRIKRIKNWMDGTKQNPFSIEIRPTYRCNLNCLSCFKHADFYEKEKEKNKDEISESEYIRIIKEAASMDVKEFLISGGGEPLLRKDVINIMCEIKKYMIKGEIITNGTLFDEDKIKRLVTCSFDHIIFSIDGPNARINDYLRGMKGSFKKSIGTIKMFSSLKEQFETELPKLTIATVLSNKNYNQLEDMIKLCKRNKVSGFRLQSLIVWSEKGKALQLAKREKSETQKHIKKALNLAKEYGIETNLNDFLSNDFVKNNDGVSLIKQSIKSDDKASCFCYAPFQNLSISENGKVRYCQMSDVSEENIKDESLKEVWYGPNLDKLRKMLLKREIPPFCKNCCSPQVFDIISTREKINKLKQ